MALGVIRLPSSFASKIGNPESTTPTAEFVVPKSIPRIISLIEESFTAGTCCVNAVDTGKRHLDRRAQK
jgi:hypothetical protein